MCRLFLFMVWMLMLHQSVTGQGADSWLILGLEAEEAGEYEQALEIWVEARSQLDEPSLSIAVEYLRLVTEQQFKDYYPMASSIYMWGLSVVEITERNIPALEAELARIEPLLEYDQYDRWSAMLNERDPLLFDEIRGYWQSLNPVPGRSYNPRLLEHWERIAYAREYFTRANETPYGTDARGRYHVMYGEPDRKDEDLFPLSQTDIRRVLDESDEDSIRNIFNVLYQRTGAPHHYEIWIYYRPSEMLSNLVLMFGQRSAGGFGRLYTLEDLVPVNMFLSRRPYHGRAVMAMLEVYYDYLAVQDSYFSSLAHRIKDMGGNPMAFKSGSLQSTFQLLRSAPEQISTEENSVPPIPIEVYQYRLLDEVGEPILLSFVESRSTTAFVLDQDESRPSDTEELLSQYRLTHGLHLSDEHRRTLTQSRYQPALWIDTFEDTPSSSVFTVPFISTKTTQLFYAELENTDPESSPRFESLIPDEIRGVGKVELMQPEPLPSDGRLLLGDLIMGYQRQSEAIEGTRFPFFVSNSRQIPEGENLVVHFELYNLELDNSGIADFEVEYDIRSVRRILFWDQVVSEDDLSITLSFQHDAPRFTESLEIETQGLEPGNYELVWSARDLTSGEETVQNLQFEIVSNEE